MSSDWNQSEAELNVISFDGIQLAGTLTLPAQARALVVTVHGSMLQTRDGDLDGSKLWMFPQGAPKRGMFLDVANALAKEDIATFRYDKRASGASEGSYLETDLEVLVEDLKSVVNDLKKRFPGLPIGILGQSEGSLTALKGVAEGMEADFLILQGPVLEPLEKFMGYQKDHAAALFLQDPDTYFEKFPYLTAWYLAYFKGDLLHQIHETDDKYYTLKYGSWSVEANLKKYREYRWDGMELLKSARMPTLVLVGEKDGNVNPESVRRLKQIQLASGAFPNVQTKIFAGLEHSFREVLPGETFIDAMSKPISPAYLSAIREFSRDLVAPK